MAGMRGAQGRPPPREACLIRERRIAQVPRLSMRRAAHLAGIAAQSWANVETGQKNLGAGIVVPHEGSADMVARMASVVGVTPDELAGAGREDAAAILAIIDKARPSARAADTIGQAVDAISAASGLTERQKVKLRQMVEQLVDRVQ